jgi:hypothetical protein
MLIGAVVRNGPLQEGEEPSSYAAIRDMACRVEDAALLTGTPEHVAGALRGYANLGISHVMIEFAPNTTSALDRLASAVRLFRG